MRPHDRLSLIIATRNRAARLRETLARLDLADVRASDTEVILVDNASTDDTAAILREFRRTAGVPVITLREAGRGSGKARNAGIKAAAGAYLLFTDDDCYLERGYLAKARHLFTEQEMDYGGGRTLLFDDADAPEAVNAAPEPRVFPPRSVIAPGQILGANMFFKREVVRNVGWFDPIFGSGTPFPCDDLEYATRCSFAGYTGHHVPELVVHHHHGRRRGGPAAALRMKEYQRAVGACRMRSLLLGRWEVLGQFAAQLRHDRPHAVHALAGAVQYLGRRVVGGSRH